MRGVHIFEKPCCREIRVMRGRAMRGLPVLQLKKFVKLPDANISGNHVHKANPGHEFVFVDVHFMIEKNKVHLNKYKNHL